MILKQDSSCKRCGENNGTILAFDSLLCVECYKILKEIKKRQRVERFDNIHGINPRYTLNTTPNNR